MGLLLLVRHGQASFGAADYDVLSEAGHDQCRALGRWLADSGPAPATVVHGGLRRHRETWAAIADGAGWEPSVAEVDANWDEFDHLAVIDRHPERPGGDLDRRAFQALFEQATARWIAGEDHYPEAYDDFVARARRALDSAADRPGPALVVTSGGVIAAVAAALVVPPRQEGEDGPGLLGHVWGRFNTVVANTSVTRVIMGATGARLLSFNEHAHLQREQVTYR